MCIRDSNSTEVSFTGGTVAADALAGRYVLIGGQRVKVKSNTAAKLVLEQAVTASDKAAIDVYKRQGERRRGEIGRKKGIPWEEMRERYEAGGISFRALGKLYGVTERAVSRHAQDEDWYGQRRWSRTKRMETQTCLANVARQLNRAAASAAERMDMGEADVREIKELAGLLQALVGLGKALEDVYKRQHYL